MVSVLFQDAVIGECFLKVTSYPEPDCDVMLLHHAFC